jgi:hypothetical protein
MDVQAELSKPEDGSDLFGKSPKDLRAYIVKLRALLRQSAPAAGGGGGEGGAGAGGILNEASPKVTQKTLAPAEAAEEKAPTARVAAS